MLPFLFSPPFSAKPPGELDLAARILAEQALVKKRSKEFEPNTSKVGLEAIKEMAKQQEKLLMGAPETSDDEDVTLDQHVRDSMYVSDDNRELSEAIADDLDFLRFDPKAEHLSLDEFRFEPPDFGPEDPVIAELIERARCDPNSRLVREGLVESPLLSKKREEVEATPPSKKPGKFPLEIDSPMQSPVNARNRLGSHRCLRFWSNSNLLSLNSI